MGRIGGLSDPRSMRSAISAVGKIRSTSVLAERWQKDDATNQVLQPKKQNPLGNFLEPLNRGVLGTLLAIDRN